MRHKDFNLDELIADAIANEADFYDTVEYLWPGMTHEDLTADELARIDDRTHQCDDCGYLDYKGNMTWLDQPRGYYCEHCHCVYTEDQYDESDIEDTE